MQISQWLRQFFMTSTVPLRFPPAMSLKKEHIARCQLVEDRVKLLEYYPKHGVGAELGVLAGDFSNEILRIVQPKTLYLIDTFASEDWAWIEDKRFTPERHYHFVEERFKREIGEERVVLKRGNSWEVLAGFPDAFFDFVYIDADHSYQAVKKDLETAGLKVKEAGLIALNDYISFDHQNQRKYGVVEAVNEFCNVHDYEMVFFALEVQMFNDVVLKKRLSA